MPTLEERRFEHDQSVKQQEFDLKEREIAVAERESRRWLTPTMMALLAATLGLAGNVVVSGINNYNTQELERLRGQSNLVLEAIKTGNPDAACKNLTFFVGLGLLSDSTRTIRKQCSSVPLGAPSLPVNVVNPVDITTSKSFYGLLNSARNALGNENTGVALDFFVQAARQIPKGSSIRNPQALDQARKALDQNKFKEALDSFKAAFGISSP